MKKFRSYTFRVLLVLYAAHACTPSARLTQPLTLEQTQKHFTWAMQQLKNPGSEYVLVAAHRGDWRNAPENSIEALKNAITMGADIAELDLKKTKDGHLIIMHDRTIDRTTNGKGRAEDYTLEEIKKFKLKNGLGRATENVIPTFKEYLEVARGKIIVDVDKGFAYFPDVIKRLREMHMLDQAIINVDDNTTLDEAETRYGKIAEDIVLMPIVAYNDKEKARSVAKSYTRHRNTIFQPVWNDDEFIKDEDFNQLKKEGYGMWLNSLWPSLNGGHDDDKAVEQNQTDSTWGWLINRGATVLQTDRPVQLLNYLSGRKLR